MLGNVLTDAAGLGLEPRLTASKAAVLPLHNPRLRQMAEREGYEPSTLLPATVFKTAAHTNVSRSAYQTLGQGARVGMTGLNRRTPEGVSYQITDTASAHKLRLLVGSGAGTRTPPSMLTAWHATTTPRRSDVCEIPTLSARCGHQ